MLDVKWYYCKDCKRWIYSESRTIIKCIWCGKEL